MGSNWPPMRRRGPVVNESEIAALESRLGFSLPDDYRRFLLEVNGGRTARSHAEISNIVITGLLGLGDRTDPSCDLDECAEWARNVLPSPDLMMIGYSEIGMVMLAHAGPHRGEVWHKDSGNTRPTGSNPRVLWHDRRDLKKLANSFEEFMVGLGPDRFAVQAP